MDAMPLALDEYQRSALRSDKTKHTGGLDIAMLGLVGEVGSLLSETKKKQRDAQSYVGYEDSVTEEMGDVLWYLAVLAHHLGISLSELAQSRLAETNSKTSFSELQPQQMLALQVPTAAFERTLLRLAGQVGEIAATGGDIALLEASMLRHILPKFFSTLVQAADEAGITLETAAIRNIKKAEDRWPTHKIYPRLFDSDFPKEEQLPRTLTVDIIERKGSNGKKYVVQRCNGIFIGDRLTDNIIAQDDYRFHDAFHYAYAAILGWSPITRALFKQKRKSEVRVDEGEDGARAGLIEEGIATFVFGEAKRQNFFEGRGPGDLGLTFLKSVRQFVRGYEVEACPLWLWEEAILAGNDAFRFLQDKREGRLQLDLDQRRMYITEIPA